MFWKKSKKSSEGNFSPSYKINVEEKQYDINYMNYGAPNSAYTTPKKSKKKIIAVCSILAVLLIAVIGIFLGSRDSLDDILGTYKGSYFATQGETGLTLTVYKEDDKYKALFDFYNLPGMTNAKNGKYYMDVSYDKKTDKYVFVATEWIEHPENYYLLDLNGKLAGDVLSGKSPTKFSVKKVTEEADAKIPSDDMPNVIQDSYKDNNAISDGNSSALQENIPSDAIEYNGHRYKIYSNVCQTWEEAKEYCENRGGYLAVISSKEENDTLFSYATSNGFKNVYFGYSDSQDEGNWCWIRDNYSSYTNWRKTEPNNERSNEDYAMFYWKFSDGTWNDGNFGQGTVSDNRNFICEWDW